MSPTLAWILVLVTACSVGMLAYLLLERRRKGEPPMPRQWSLTPRPVFNAQEQRVHRQLREALPQHVILAKLPLVRFCQPTDPLQVRYWYDLLGATHVTFAVCDAHGRVLAAIDVDDGRTPARRLLQIKQSVLATCQIRYARYSAQHTPSVPELQTLVPAAALPVPAVPSAARTTAEPAAGARTRAPAAAPAVATASAPAAPTAGAARPAPTSVEALRQRARPARWPDGGYLKDSSFGRDSVISGFSNTTPSRLPDRGGEVIDTPPLRH